MAIDGNTSFFPCSIDNWGSAFENNICQKATAARWNEIQDALFRAEEYSLRVMLTGKQGVLTHPTSGSTRPAVLFKAYTVTATGSATITKTFQMPPFTAAEKALFGGTPLASVNSVHLQIRRDQLGSSKKCYHCGIKAPILDTSGDTPWFVAASTLRHGNDDETIAPGVYIISLLITGG